MEKGMGKGGERTAIWQGLYSAPDAAAAVGTKNPGRIQ